LRREGAGDSEEQGSSDELDFHKRGVQSNQSSRRAQREIAFAPSLAAVRDACTGRQFRLSIATAWQ
jgi:hypothetical protein